jgi:hypothetical protein
MAGDYSRIPDGLLRHFSSVLMQQGRVHLDSDWNEMARLAAHRWTTQADDTFGPAAVPRLTTPNGFAITAATTTPADLLIGAGRCYVDGLQAELFPQETFGGKAISYLNQPFLPGPPPAITANGLVFLDVWEREVTAVEVAPALLDPALGGVDTTTRLQTVWQVKLLTADPTSTNPVSCSTDLNAVFPASAGIISTLANAPVAPTDPCILPDQGGYRGIENRLYRVQIHTGGNTTAARWKWSRENASVVSRVLTITTSGATSTLTLDSTGRDSVLRVSANDWVEITDDVLELTGQPGVMVRIVGQPNDATGTVVLDRALPGSFNPADATRHTRLIRWDQQQGVDTNGLLPISAGQVELEDGVFVTLTLDPSAPSGTFHVGDWWAVAARTADASVEVLNNAPPFGIRHHYCPLATFTVSGGAVTVTGDCRTLWPPATTAGTDCCCTVCVTADAHNAGTATIAMALETVRRLGGGRVCLGPGLFILPTTLVANGLKDVIIAGQGAATALICTAGGPAVSAESNLGLRIEDLAVFAIAPAATFAPAAAPIGILLRNSMDVAVQRCGIAALAPGQPSSTGTTNIGVSTNVGAATTGALVPAGMAIGLDGFLIEGVIGQNELFAAIGLGKAGLVGAAQTDGAGIVAYRRLMLLAGLRASGNWILCSVSGVSLGDVTPSQTGYSAYMLQTAITGNFVLGGVLSGIFLQGYTAPGAAVQVAANHIEVAGPGIIAGLDGCTIVDNHVTQLDGAAALSTASHTANPTATPGIIAVPIAGTLAIGEIRILRNRVFGIFGPGISLDAPILAAAVIDNAIAATAGAGIVTGAAGAIATAIVRGNEVFVVNAPASPDAGVVAGIDIANAANAVVQDNVLGSIASTGTMAAAAGIQLRQVSRATVAGNDISDVGQSGAGALVGYGINAASVQVEVTLRGNTVRQSATAQTQAGEFSAVRIRPAVGATGQGATTCEVSVSDNALEGSSVLSLVDVQGADACVMTANRCRVNGTTSATGLKGSAPAVSLQAQTAIVGENRIQGASTTFDLSITVPFDAEKQLGLTLLGNIVTAGIEVNNALLPTSSPWAPLNIVL